MERVAEMVCVQGFRGSDAWLGTDLNDPPVGSASMTLMVVCRRLRNTWPSAIQEPISHSNNVSTSDGWRFLAGATSPQFQVRDSAATIALTSSYDFTTVKDELVIACMAYDGVNGARLRVNGVSDTTPAVNGGYTPAAATRVLTLGNRTISLNQPCTDLAIVAFLGSDTVSLDVAGLAAAEAQLRADLKNGRDLRAALVAADLVYYDARDAVQNGQVKGTWAPRVGAGVTLTRSGALGAASYQART